MLNKVKDFVEYIMLDIMDGVFVPGRSLDFDYYLPTNLKCHAHLMVVKPIKYLSRLPVEADTAIIHIESVKDAFKVINVSHDQGLRTFLAINPNTPVETVAPYLPKLDGVLVMTVQPGRYGSSFLPQCLGKVRALRAMDEGLVIEVDGGMNPETAARAVEMGADAVAVGSYILASDDPMNAYTKLMEAVHTARLRTRRI